MSLLHLSTHLIFLTVEHGQVKTRLLICMSYIKLGFLCPRSSLAKDFLAPCVDYKEEYG